MTDVSVAAAARLLGLPEVRSSIELVERLRSGLPSRTLQVLAEAMDLPRTQLLKLLNISEPTARRRTQADQALKSDESDRALRIARVFARAEEVFEDRDNARKWLQRSNRALGGVTPLSLLDTELGAREVDTILGRIEYGVFS